MFSTVRKGSRLAKNSPINIARVLDGVKPKLASPELRVEHAA